MDKLADFSNGDIIKLHINQISRLKEIVDSNVEKKRYRFCMHASPDEKLQDMFICRKKGDYCRPDKHRGMPESHTIIEGRELIILFDNDGMILDSFILDRSDGYLSYRINSEVFHMTVVLSEFAIDYEVKEGPFRKDKIIFPKWAPIGDNNEENSDFINRILENTGVQS